MANRFLTHENVPEISDGTSTIFGVSLSANNLVAGKFVRADDTKTLVSADIPGVGSTGYSDIIPSGDDTFDIGEPAKRFKHTYSTDVTAEFINAGTVNGIEVTAPAPNAFEVSNGPLAVLSADATGVSYNGLPLANFDQQLNTTDDVTFNSVQAQGLSAPNIAQTDPLGGVSISGTADSTSTTTGALVVDGGVGIAKKLVVGNSLKFGNTSTMTLKRRTDNEVTFDNPTPGAVWVRGPLTPGITASLALGTLTGNEAGFMQYRYVAPDDPGNSVCFTHRGSNCKFHMYEDGLFKTQSAQVTDTTDSTSPTTGALQVAGGVGIQGLLNGAQTSGGLYSQQTFWPEVLGSTILNTETSVFGGTGAGSRVLNECCLMGGSSLYCKVGGTIRTGADKEYLTVRMYLDSTDDGGSKVEIFNSDQGDRNTIGDDALMEIAKLDDINNTYEIEFDFVVRQGGVNGEVYSNVQMLYAKNTAENGGRITSKWQLVTGVDLTKPQKVDVTFQWGDTSGTVVNQSSVPVGGTAVAGTGTFLRNRMVLIKKEF